MPPGVEFFHHHHLNRCATRLEEGRDALPFAHYLLARFVDNHSILANDTDANHQTYTWS